MVGAAIQSTKAIQRTITMMLTYSTMRPRGTRIQSMQVVSNEFASTSMTGGSGGNDEGRPSSILNCQHLPSSEGSASHDRGSPRRFRYYTFRNILDGFVSVWIERLKNLTHFMNMKATEIKMRPVQSCHVKKAISHCRQSNSRICFDFLFFRR